ncbi:MAG: RNA pyrophosphohydrolase [Gammaproteobacteria bacterium]|nr:RNA pyrophosphohydrolase [Gammaproteobacteria bacterium]NNC97065.1 RNA pyrophosphohydrolase [Gammaproteobacteria bacterium]NNM14339.1 RNA pyrophosphohydrolase [Gammaproteobacteria bacterium]
MTDHIDSEGYRANVGIILTNGSGKLLWARRKGKRGWQFPQGGIDQGESAEEAMFRELQEEVGLLPQHVKILGSTRDWLHYRLPKRFQRLNNIIPVIGQKQRWFLLRLTSDEDKVKLDNTSHPEFDRWRWVNYWYPVSNVIYFKQQVYRKALKQLYVHLRNDQHDQDQRDQEGQNSEIRNKENKSKN